MKNAAIRWMPRICMMSALLCFGDWGIPTPELCASCACCPYQYCAQPSPVKGSSGTLYTISPNDWAYAHFNSSCMGCMRNKPHRVNYVGLSVSTYSDGTAACPSATPCGATVSGSATSTFTQRPSYICGCPCNGSVNYCCCQDPSPP
jgi:hypothetical protein